MDKFYNNDKAVIERKINVAPRNVESTEDIPEKYSLAQCTQWIKDNQFRKVCLQFPDHLLKDSVGISLMLQKSCEQMVYIMADTSYESCCIDYVNAAHIEADAIIHFGNSCLSKPSYKIPTLFIYERWSINLDQFVTAVEEFFVGQSDDFSIVIDTPYFYKLDDIREKLKSSNNCKIIPIGEDPSENCIYVGINDRKLTVFELSYKISKLFFYDPLQHRTITAHSQNTAILKRRHFLVEKIKDAKTVAICIGTLAISNYLNAIQRVKALCKLHSKKYYIISVGKINVAKLANFPEMDVYVLISCAMNDIFDSREFYRPIVTCYDVELALNPEISPETSFTYDFTLSNVTPLPDKLSMSENNSDVSLLTGSIRHVESNCDSSSSNALTSEIDKSIAIQTNDSFVRTWRGLDRIEVDNLPVKIAEEGRTGIASGYKSEIS